MTPRLVLRMAMPMPSSTGFSCVLRRYSRRPGRLALRMRVSMSATGSVIMMDSPSPARLLDAGDQPVGGQVPEANPADAELAVDGAGPAAQPAAHADADAVARPQLRLGRVALEL